MSLPKSQSSVKHWYQMFKTARAYISESSNVVSWLKVNLCVSKYSIDWFYLLYSHSFWNTSLIVFSTGLKKCRLDRLNVLIDLFLIMQKNKSNASPNISVDSNQHSPWGPVLCSNLFTTWQISLRHTLFRCRELPFHVSAMPLLQQGCPTSDFLYGEKKNLPGSLNVGSATRQ